MQISSYRPELRPDLLQGRGSCAGEHARIFAGSCGELWGVPRPTARQHLPASSAPLSAVRTDAIGFPSSGAFGMGRPSLIALTLEVEGGALRKATIVGAEVIVSTGAFEL